MFIDPGCLQFLAPQERHVYGQHAAKELVRV